MEQVLLESGQVVQVHDRGLCIGEWCSIHHPMPGPWRDWPRYWRDDRRIMERVCPCGIGHPVAESYDWKMAVGQGADLVHDCCLEHVCSPRVTKGRNGVQLMTAAPPSPRAGITEDPADRQDFEEAIDAMILLIELWGTGPEHAPQLTMEQWRTLRHLLSKIPEWVGRIHYGS